MLNRNPDASAIDPVKEINHLHVVLDCVLWCRMRVLSTSPALCDAEPRSIVVVSKFFGLSIITEIVLVM